MNATQERIQSAIFLRNGRSVSPAIIMAMICFMHTWKVTLLSFFMPIEVVPKLLVSVGFSDGVSIQI